MNGESRPNRETPSPYEALFQLTRGVPPPASHVARESDADVLSVGRGFIQAFDYTMQLQVGCPAGCLFCYVPSSARLTPRDLHRTWGYEVRTKRRAAAKLARRLARGELADKTIYFSGVTDPYASRTETTQTLWQTFLRAPQSLRPKRIAIQTRFPVDRDLPLISAYCDGTAASDYGPPIVVSHSVGTDRDDVIRLWERAAPPFERRMKTVETLCQAGIFTVVTLSPFGPWRDLVGTLRRLRSCGVSYVTVLFFKVEHACASTPPGFLAYLRQDWPHLLDPIWQAERRAEIQAVFSPELVIEEQAGFASLAAPHLVVN